jgi:phage-related protein (TIGR01555 family)
MFNSIKNFILPKKSPNAVPIQSQLMSNVNFGLFNPVAGTGTGRAVDFYNGRGRVPYLTFQTIDEIYRSNWMCRRIIDTPASDMTKNWRKFDYSDAETIKQREQAEKRLDVQEYVRQAIQWGDLYGGSAIILGVEDDDKSMPLNLKKLKKGDLSFLNVVFKDQISPSAQIEIDPYSRNFQRPKYFVIAGSDSSLIHSSRIIQFYGAELPLYSLLRQAGWGDSKVVGSWGILEAAEKFWLDISQLVSNANIDVLHIGGYTQMLGSRPGQVSDILAFQDQMLSNYKKLILDSNDKYDRKELSGLPGLSDILREYIRMVAASAGMPLTKFLGESPGGLGSTGSKELTDYYDSIKERQNRIYRQMNYLDKIIEITTFGAYKGIDFTWNAMLELDANQKADVVLKQAQSDQIYVTLGVIDQAIVADKLQTDGTYPAITSEWTEQLKDVPDQFAETPSTDLILNQNESDKNG